MTLIRKFSLFFLPSVVHVALYIALLPIMTFVLGPADYGVVALVSAFSAFGTAIGSFGASYLIAAHYQIIDISEKKKMISTITIVGLILAMAFSACLLILWPAIKALFPIFANIPFIGLALSLLAMVLGIPWVFAYDVVVLDGKSKFYAILLVMQCIISSLMMVLCLYVFKFGLLALFIGPVFGNLITFSGAIWYLHPYLELSIKKNG